MGLTIEKYISLVANAAMSAGVRVTLSSNGGVGLAGATGDGAFDIGVLHNDVDSGQTAVIQLHAPTAVGTIAGAVTAGALLFTAANGQFSPTYEAGAVTWGVALETASAGDIQIARVIA